MYENYFGFKERPFQLVPNPAYLFLSKSHEEALAHLTYAILQGDGFVEITGEVGTGKTTLCRTFLENLNQNTEAAYIFNPKLDSVQLLKAINDEFGIPSDTDNLKTLIDTLNAFLIQKKSQGKNIILLIDEAQNLSKEVLEQLRLLSNLETTTAKLLQIILVGQPELADILDSYELRQLGQRVTLSCHLMPLNFKETREYIQHRIQVASRKPGLKFSHSAYYAIYKYSGGIPRLINIVCDRAILIAFSMERHKITGSIARAAIKELAGRGDRKIRFAVLNVGSREILILFALCMVLVLLIVYPPGNIDIHALFTNAKPSEKRISQPSLPPAPEQAETQEDKKIAEPALVEIKPVADEKPIGNEVESAIEIVQNLGYILRDMDSRSSRHTALKTAVSLWDTEPMIKEYLDDISDDQAFFQIGAKQNGLLVYVPEHDSRSEIGTGFDMIKKLNLPAILAFQVSENSLPVYLTLTQIDDKKITLSNGDIIAAEPYETEYYWSGTAYILWKNFYDYTGIIPRDAPESSVIALKTLLKDIGYEDIEINAVYDDQSRKAVEEIQEKHDINIDGVVGPLTRIILYNELKSLNIPHIRKGNEN